MKKLSAGLMLFLWLSSSIVMAQAKAWVPAEYVPHGAKETVAFEEALYNLPIAAYTLGVPPREELLTSQTLVRKIPEKHSNKCDYWLKVVLGSTFGQSEGARRNWVGIEKLGRSFRNAIVGNYEASAGQVRFIELEDLINITIYPQKPLFSKKVGALEEADVRQVVFDVLRIPEEKESQLGIEKHVAAVAGVPICYGVIRGDDNPKNLADRRWWDYIPFWMDKSRLFVCISTIDWNHPPAMAIRANEKWPAEGDKGDDAPLVPNSPFHPSSAK